MHPFTRGLIVPIEGTASPVVFQWNPEEIDGPGGDANWVPIDVAGREQPYLQYTHGNLSVIEFELQFSRHDNPDGYVQNQIDNLVNLTKPTVKMAGLSRPPLVMLILGNRPRTTCVVKSAEPSTFGTAHPISLDPYQAAVRVKLWENQA